MSVKIERRVEVTRVARPAGSAYFVSGMDAGLLTK